MAAIELIDVTKAWGDDTAVDEVSFAVEDGSFVVLLGPSGCGKSTTLRLIAGLEQVTSGQVRIAGQDVTHHPPAARRLSMVFQSYALFPHLDVAENIIFGLKVRKTPPAERAQRLARVAEIVGLSELLHRKPAQLSGGQRQRVALARAIIAENPICLMDEPLSNLDAKLRHDMRGEIRSLQRRLAMTVVYVTHDQTEAMSMADQVILLRNGRIEQAGTPGQLYDQPATTFSASFIGTPPMNLLDLADGPEGAVIAGSVGQTVLEGAGQGLRLGIRPEHIEIAEQGGLPAELVWSDYLGADTIVTARLGSQELLVRAPGRLSEITGRRVALRWAQDKVHIFDGATGKRLEGRQARAMAA
ncbi:MAG: ABC transporter ATP-binding protein [Pseudomonadota bacterium]